MIKKPTGLKERIQNAESQPEIQELLKEGDGYAKASQSTQRQWRKAADLRVSQLQLTAIKADNAKSRKPAAVSC